MTGTHHSHPFAPRFPETGCDKQSAALAGQVTASHPLLIPLALAHPLMDQISDLSHEPCFHTRFFPPSSVRAGVIKVCGKTKVAFISSRHAVSAAAVAGDLLPEKPASPETMATAVRPHFVGNDRDVELDNLASAEKKQSKGDPSVVRYRR